MRGFIHSFESFGTVDGPGIRFVVFLSGCPLRCKYCHNPDTWVRGEKSMEAADAAKEILKYRNYFSGGGGVTVSGGEPTAQISFVTELFTLMRGEGIHTALDTSGCLFDPKNEESVKAHEALLSVTDLVLLDIKHIDSKKHKELTGRGNENTLAFARYLSELGKSLWIRHVLVPDYTDDDESLLALRAFIDTLKTAERTEVLPYHTMGVAKYEKLGLDYPLKGVAPPTAERVENAKKILELSRLQ